MDKREMDKREMIIIAYDNGIRDFSNMDFIKQNLSYLRLRNCNFRYCEFEGTIFNNTNLEGSDFRYAYMKRADLSETELDCAKFKNADTRNTDLTITVNN